MSKEKRYGGKFLRILAGMIVGITVLAACSLVIGAIVMVLWNWLMPGIFGLGTIDYWQGFGIVLLAKLVFGGFGKHFPPPFARNKWQEKHWGEHAKNWDEYSKRWGEYAKHRAFCRDWRLDDDYEDWWETEGLKSFEEYMKNKGDKEDKAEEQK